MPTHGSSRSVKPLVMLALIGILTYFITNYAFSITESLPEDETLSIQTISKQEAADHAASFIRQTWGIEVESDNQTVLYQAHKMFDGYIQKYDLQNEFSQVFQKTIPLDYYEVTSRFDNRTFRVDVNMKDGHVFAWRQSNEETPDPRKQGEALARQYIQQQGYASAEALAYTEQLPAYRYLFRIPDHQVQEAALQIAVDVRGGEVIGYVPSFTVPASFVDWMDEQDHTVNWLSFLSIFLNMLMGITALVLVIFYRASLSFMRGAILTVVYAVLVTISNFNMYPAFQSMGESTAFAALMLQELFSLFTAGAVYVSAVSGDGLWRREGRHLWVRVRDRGFGSVILSSMGKGYLFCFMIMGLQNLLFFIMMKGFHVWGVNDPLFSAYNLKWPFLFPLLAWAAAISEEITYRVFGIYIFRKLFRSTIIAALLSSMIWAIGHTAYPIYPAYTRFVEVTILGLVFSYVYLKHGFFTAMFAHAAMDSILMSLSIIPLGGASNITMAVVFMLLPVAIGYIVAWIDRWIPKKAPEEPGANPNPLPPFPQRSGWS